MFASVYGGLLIFRHIQSTRECAGYYFGDNCDECGMVGGCDAGISACKNHYYGELCNFVCRDVCTYPTRCYESLSCDKIYLYQDKWFKR